MTKLDLSVPAISCNHCAHTIEMELMELEGVSDVAVDVAARSVTVGYETPADENAIRALLAEIQYPVAA